MENLWYGIYAAFMGCRQPRAARLLNMGMSAFLSALYPNIVYIIYTSSLNIETMLESLLTSRTRSHLIVLFFSEPGQEYWLREAARAVHMNINAVRREVLRLEEAGIITGMKRGNQRVFRADTSHPFFPDLLSMVEKERSHAQATSPLTGRGRKETIHGDLIQDPVSALQTDAARERARRCVCYRVEG